MITKKIFYDELNKALLKEKLDFIVDGEICVNSSEFERCSSFIHGAEWAYSLLEEERKRFKKTLEESLRIISDK